MKRLIAQRYTIRRNFISVICASLAVYFAWHALLGDRSLLRLKTLDAQVGRLDGEVAALESGRQSLESDVERLRPGSLDPDMLEERARIVLGFNYPSEHVLLKQ